MKMSRTAKVLMMRDGEWPESRFRDNRGREHYDNGRYAPARSEYIPPYYHDRRDETEKHTGSEWDHGEDMRYRPPRNGSDISWDGSGKFRTEYETVDGRRRAIGFGGPEMRVENPWPINEMANRTGSTERGYYSSEIVPPMTKERAEEWMKNLHNEDGTTGAHWSYDQTTNLMRQKGYNFDPIEFYAAINVMYSDYCKVAKKMNVNTVDFFASMAEAFLADQDAVEDKLAAYYAHIVK